MKSWKSSFVAILIAETLAMAGFSLSVPIIPFFLQEDIGISDPQRLKLWVGILQAIPAVTLAIFAPIWGHLADIYSRRLMLLRAMFGGAIIISLMCLVNSPWQLLILRSIQGCITGTVAAATVLTAGIAPAAQVGFALGILQTGIAVGNSIGPLFGGLISDFLGYRVAFLSTGVILALGGLIVLKGVEDDSRHRLNAKKDKNEKGKKVSFIPDVKPIINSPTLRTLLFVSFVIQAAIGIAVPMLPLFLKELALKAASEGPRYIGSSTGLVLGAGAASAALAAVLVGKYSARIGYWKTLIYCLTIGAILTIPQAFVSNAGQLALFRALSAFFIGGISPVLNAIIAINTDKENQGSIYGFNSSIASAGAAFGPMIGAGVAMINYRAVFLTAAGLLGFTAYRTFKRRQEKFSTMM